MRARSLACTRLVLMLSALLLVATAAAPALPTVTAGGAEADRAVGGEAALVAIEGVDRVRPAGVPAPEVRSRADWDPNGGCEVSQGDRTRPQRITVHHTHEPTVQEPGEVKRAMRLICRVHQERGFDEIGYHYAIDPWGRIWQGRGPLPSEITERVRNGAHAQGFNDNAIGVVFIGDYEEERPPEAAVEAGAALMAFLADQYAIAPDGVAQVTSTGGPNTRFPEGTTIDLAHIAGHRDTGDGTACPGRHLYALLPWFRQEVAQRLAAP